MTTIINKESENNTEINLDNFVNSKKQVKKNNYWNDEHENILISLQKSSFRLSKEYQKIYFRLKKRLLWYRIPIIIISAIGGFLSLSNSGYIPAAYNKWVSLFVGFSNLLVTIISLIENLKKIDIMVNGTYSAHLNFQKLHDEISIIKRIPPNEREENGYDIVNKLFTKYEAYLIDAPISEKINKDDLGNNEYNDNGTFKSNELTWEKNNSKLYELDDLESQINKINKNNNKIKRKIDMINIINEAEVDAEVEAEFTNINDLSKK